MGGNAELVKRFYGDVLNRGDLDALDQIATEDYVEHDPMPGQREGRDGLRDRVQMLRAGLDPSYTVEDIVDAGDRVAIRWTMTGTNHGELMGMPPTGKSFGMSGIDIVRVRDGRLAEHWHAIDQLGLLIQLGVVQPPGAPA